MNKRIIFSDKEKNEIKHLYLHGMSSVVIGQKYGVSYKTILKILHELDVCVDQKRFVRKYTLNEYYFDIIDTPNKAYILGFLWADGHNDVDKSTVTISLQEEDRDILEIIRKELNSSKPLEFIDNSNKNDYGYHYKNQYRLSFFSKHLCLSLEKIGMIKNKSLLLTFPIIPTHLYSHFIRGYFDGDGSIYENIKNDNNHAITVTITSTISFCDSIKKICKEILKINPHIYDASCHNGITKVFTISGRNVAKVFLDWIYCDANMYLKRKYIRYLNYYNINNSLLV